MKTITYPSRERSYVSAYHKKWRQAHKERIKAYNEAYKQRAKEDRKRMTDYLNELKSAPCMDCGNRFPAYVMDFDHRPGTDKIGQVSRMSTCLTERVKREAAKCDVVCSNCHRIRTFARIDEARTTDKGHLSEMVIQSALTQIGSVS